MMTEGYKRTDFHHGARFMLNGKICKVTVGGGYSKVTYDMWHSRNVEENTHHEAYITTMRRMADAGLITFLTEKNLSHAERLTAWKWTLGTFSLTREQAVSLKTHKMRSEILGAASDRMYGRVMNLLRDAGILN